MKKKRKDQQVAIARSKLNGTWALYEASREPNSSSMNCEPNGPCPGTEPSASYPWRPRSAQVQSGVASGAGTGARAAAGGKKRYVKTNSKAYWIEMTDELGGSREGAEGNKRRKRMERRTQREGGKANQIGSVQRTSNQYKGTNVKNM